MGCRVSAAPPAASPEGAGEPGGLPERTPPVQTLLGPGDPRRAPSAAPQPRRAQVLLAHLGAVGSPSQKHTWQRLPAAVAGLGVCPGLHPTAPGGAVHPGLVGLMSTHAAVTTPRSCAVSGEAAGLETAPKGTSGAAPLKWALFML